jgi:hypothetical protein
MAGMGEGFYSSRKLNIGGILFVGQLDCLSRPVVVPFFSICGAPGGAQKSANGFGAAEAAGAMIGCKGIKCVKDLRDKEFGYYLQYGPYFGFLEGPMASGGGAGCFGAGAGAGEGFAGGTLACWTWIWPYEFPWF